jgi:SOS-response transcriptional repressor LexA
VLALNEKNGVPPTMREIADYLGFSSGNAACEQVRRLKRKGYLENINGKARASIVKR